MKKIKRLILHIGTIKTGTTSIQDSLGKGRDTLLKHNIYYPSIQPYNHVFTFPPIFLIDPEKIDWFRRRLISQEDKNNKIQGYINQWLNEFKTCGKSNDFIISAEHLALPFFDTDAISRLKKFIEPYFEKVIIIAYIRHYDTWIASEIQQSVQNGFTAGATLEEIVRNLQNCPPFLSYRESLQKWVNLFGQESVVVRPFDPINFYKQSLLADFFHACNMPADEISIPEIRSNESIGKNAVLFLQKYNQAYPVFINGKINKERGLVREGNPLFFYKNLTDEKFRLALVYSATQAQKFNEEIDYVNQFFSKGYQFKHISHKEGETQIPRMDDIPIEFFLELFNNYNKRIMLQRNRIEMLTKENAYLRRFFELLKIPFFLRVINKLPLLKIILQKIIRFSR